MTQHTPTPWVLDNKDGIIFADNHPEKIITYVPINKTSLQNAAFIVKAVNAYDELVEALERYIYATTQSQLDSAIEASKKALAKAKGAA